MKTVTIHKAKTTLSQLIAAVEAGEEVIIARGDEPVAKIVRIEKKGKREAGRLKGKGSVGPEFFEPMTEEELQEWGS
ncbi:MAG: type II toxin-antitoxin system prevent-host-death family antitoxin [Alphaproteobacteria bacterium]|nr:type II toxin-antitoxin system prevent-host-death family antitoxin [Alphaproteobacteria bacterium]